MDESANERFQLLMAADDEDPEVQYQLGLCYLNGIGTPQDGQRAQDYFQRAAEQGHEAAQKLLGEESTPVTSGDAPAPDAANLPELCRAAEDGDAEAQYRAACWFMQSDMPGSSDEADRYLNMAAEQGHGQACLLLGKRALQNDASEQAIELLQNAADCGLGEAMMLLGECYASGNGVDRDTQKAEEFLTQGANAIGGTAFLDLAMRYAIGDGVPVMLGKALSLVQNAKDSGIADAQQQYECRYAEYQKQQEELAAQREQERLAAEEAERLRQEEEARQQAELVRQAEERRRQAEAEAQRRREEQERREAEQKRAREEWARQQAERQREAEAQRRQEEEKRKEEERRTKAEWARQQAERQREAEEQRRQEEFRRQAEAKAKKEKIIQTIKSPKVIIPAVLLVVALIAAAIIFNAGAKKNAATDNMASASSENDESATSSIVAAGDAEEDEQADSTVSSASDSELSSLQPEAEDTADTEESSVQSEVAAESEEPEPEVVMPDAGSYVVHTADQEPLSFLSASETIPYNGIVYASEFKEVGGSIQAWVRYGAVEGWVLFNSLSWLGEEDYAISVGDECYIAVSGCYIYEDETMSSRIWSSVSFLTLSYGSAATVIEINGALVNISCNGYEGWVYAENLSKYLSDFQYQTNYLNEDEDTGNTGVELKESRDDDSETLTVIPNGVTLDIQYYESGWGVVSYEGQTGFVQMRYMTPVVTTLDTDEEETPTE